MNTPFIAIIKKKFCRLDKPLLFSFIACLIYWIYLIFATRMDISCDAITYEKLGTMLYKNGWIQYFKTGPNREPLYPFIISFAMNLAGSLGIFYQIILRFIQVAILLLTQWLAYRILKKLRIRKIIVILTIIYIGFSPAIVNTAFSLYSEIAAYPFILGIILAAAKSWQKIQQGRPKDSLLLGAIIGILFLLITSVKSVYAYVFFLFLSPYVALAISSFMRKRTKILLNAFLFLLTASVVFNSAVILYKSTNQKYNGVYDLTDRGTWALYGSAVRRSEKLTLERLETAVAYIPGEGFCNSIFGEEKCRFWHPSTSDTYGVGKFRELTEMDKLPKDKADAVLMSSIIEKTLQHPVQFFLLNCVDALKMFFWESTKMGFVSYPDWLAKIFDLALLKNSLRLIISCLSFWAFLYLMILTIKKRSPIFNPVGSEKEEFYIPFFIFRIVLAHVLLYSPFNTVGRWALPIAPLYLIAIAFSINQIIEKYLSRRQTH
jgi:hypothetical protein